jgi:hypothetical protein
MIGDFAAEQGEERGSAEFVRSVADAASALEGLTLMGQPLRGVRCWLSRDASESAEGQPLDVTITDKHGLKHHAFNLQAEFAFDDSSLNIGLTQEQWGNGRDQDLPRGNGKSDSWWV